MADYSYQNEYAEKTLRSATEHGACVLGGAVGCGKTTIAQIIINKFVAQNGPNSRILVLTENLKSLEDQFIDELNNAHINIEFSFSRIGDDRDTQVKVGIAANINKLRWDTFDLLIVDEAHRHYGKNRIDKFVQHKRPNMQILLTGSPSKFIASNRWGLSRMPIHCIAGEALQEKGVYAPVDLFVTRLKSKIDPIQSIRSVFEHAKSESVRMGKVLVVAPTISFAERLNLYLSMTEKSVFLSTSKNDAKNQEIDKFKKARQGVLVAVSKCSLGFNCSDLDAIIDFKSSMNVDTSNQVFARILRRSPDGKRKSYFRVSGTDSKSYNQQVIMLHKIVSLMEKDIFENFDGKNLRMERVG